MAASTPAIPTAAIPTPAIPPPAIRVRDARFGYGSHEAARADIEIDAGDVVAVLGPNGSGKSTLVKGMLGLVDVLGGSVEWFGRPLQEADRSMIGYVPQRQSAAGPIPVTVDELVRSGRLAANGWWRRSRAEDRRAVDAAIDVVGLTGQRGRPVSRLSGGQQRRALVARGLAGGARVLILDEPLAGVDAASQAALADTLRVLAEAGTTIVIVLHELGPIQPLVTRVVAMSAGAVEFDGPVADVPKALLHDDHADDAHGGVYEEPGDLGLFRGGLSGG
jgi:zinc transport system ATP-binding protein